MHPVAVQRGRAGRPRGAMSRQRNWVERPVGKLKQFRRVATRYEKLGETFLPVVHLAATFILTR